MNHNTSIYVGFVKFLNGGNYWFLYTLFVIFFLFPLFERLIKDNNVIKFVLLCIGMLIGNAFDLPNICQLKNIVYFFPYFLLGNIISVNVKDQRILSLNNSRNIIIGLIVSIFVYVLIESILIEENSLSFLRYLGALSMILFLYIICCYLSRLSDIRYVRIFNSFLSRCSYYSLQIYLLNGLLLVASRVLVVNVLHIYIPALIVLAIFFLVIGVSLLLCKLFEKWHMGKVLLGIP